MKRNLAQKEADYKRIAWMNSWYFGDDDWSSDYDTIREYSYIAEYDSETTELIGFVLYEFYNDYVRGLRSGVLRTARGTGVSVRLYKRMIRMARRKDVEYKTYCAHDNIPSINAHIKSGQKIEKIETLSDGFICVHLTS